MRVGALFAVLTLALTYPLSLTPGTTSVGGDPDVELFTWILAWNAHAFVHAPLSIFDANIFYPFDGTLAYSENLIGSALLVAPLVWATGNPVLAMNAVSLLSCAVCGLGAFVLARRFGLPPAAAFICGLIFAFSPARFSRFPQLHLTTVQWMPFALASLHGYFDNGRRRDLRLAVAFFTLQALTSGHGAVLLLVLLAAFVVYRLAIGAPVDPIRRLRDIGWPGALLLAPAVLIVLPYLAVQSDIGLRRALAEWSTAPESFLASPSRLHMWLMARLTDHPINDRASAFLFPGYLPLLLAAAAFLPGLSPERRRHAIFFALLMVLAVAVSIGPSVGLWPYIYWLPGMNFIRVPSRFFLLAVLAIAILAAIGFERLARVWPRHRTRVAGVAVSALLVAEFSLVPLPVQPFRIDIPAADRWLATQPTPFVVAEVPVGPFERYHTTYMLHSMAHWQRTVHGYSGVVPPLHERLYAELRRFPDDTSVMSLADLGVTHVVVHPDMYPPGEWAMVEQRLEHYRQMLTLQYADDRGRVYALNR